MVEYLGHTLELPLGSRRAHFARFDLPDGGFFEVFDAADPAYLHFTTGPVVGFEVADFDRARTELVRAGYALLGPPGGEPKSYRWQHFRGPDALVLEIVDYPDRPPPGPPVGALGVTSIAWMGISTPRFEAVTGFYRRTLGLRVEESTPDLIECGLPDGSSVEAFRRDSPMDHAHFRTGPVPGLGVTDLRQALLRLEERGVPILDRRLRELGGWAHFRAPDGNVYEVKQSAVRHAGPRPRGEERRPGTGSATT